MKGRRIRRRGRRKRKVIVRRKRKRKEKQVDKKEGKTEGKSCLYDGKRVIKGTQKCKEEKELEKEKLIYERKWESD